MLIVGGPLKKNVADILGLDFITTDRIHAISHILASESANTCPMIVIGLCHIPVVFGQEVDVGSTESITGDDGSLILLSTSDSIVSRSNLRGSRELIESAVVSAAGLESIPDYLHVLRVSSENKGDILEQINDAGSVGRLAIVDGH